MENLTRYPWLIFVAAFAALWLASVMGSWLRRRNSSAEDEQREDLGIILGATLTLPALIIGFSISMASSRYDQRKKPRPTLLGPKCYVLTFCRRPMLRMFAAFLALISTSASCSTSIGTPLGNRRSISRPANYKPISG